MKEIQTARSLVPQIELLKQKTQLGTDSAGKRPLSIAITSCEVGEGVTTTAVNLAASLKQDPGVHVLLVDGNVTDRGVEKYLRCGKMASISQIVADSNLANMPIHHISGGLDLLVAKKEKDGSGLNTFFSGLNGTFKRLNESYNVIILDCPPIRTMYSSLSLFRSVDGVILVIQAERVRSEIIQREIDLLKGARANLLGCVLNKRRFPIPNFIYKRI